MTKIEALRLEADARELVEGTGLAWWQVIKFLGRTKNGEEHPWSLDSHEKSDYELALRVLEDRPVWEGDLVYTCDGRYITATQDSIACEDHLGYKLSWNPPKPKTVMVELLVEDAEFLAIPQERFWNIRIENACRKALEKVK